MARNSVFRFKFLASYECRDRLSCSGKEIDWRLSDYYSKHAARTFIPSKHIPRYDRWCQSKTTLLFERTSATRMGHNKSRTRYLLFFNSTSSLSLNFRDPETIICVIVYSPNRFKNLHTLIKLCIGQFL